MATKDIIVIIVLIVIFSGLYGIFVDQHPGDPNAIDKSSSWVKKKTAPVWEPLDESILGPAVNRIKKTFGFSYWEIVWNTIVTIIALIWILLFHFLLGLIKIAKKEKDFKWISLISRNTLAMLIIAVAFIALNSIPILNTIFQIITFRFFITDWSFLAWVVEPLIAAAIIAAVPQVIQSYIEYQKRLKLAKIKGAARTGTTVLIGAGEATE